MKIKLDNMKKEIIKDDIEEVEITEAETEGNAAHYQKRWTAAIPKIIKAYPKLTKEDLMHNAGSEHLRFKVMMKKTGLSRDELITFLNSLEN